MHQSGPVSSLHTFREEIESPLKAYQRLMVEFDTSRQAGQKDEADTVGRVNLRKRGIHNSVEVREQQQ